MHIHCCIKQDMLTSCPRVSVHRTLITRRVSYLNTVLQVPAEVDVGHLDHLQLIGLLHVLDPLVGLTLGVNHQGPAVSTHHNDGILHRVTVNMTSMVRVKS